MILDDCKVESGVGSSQTLAEVCRTIPYEQYCQLVGDKHAPITERTFLGYDEGTPNPMGLRDHPFCGLNDGLLVEIFISGAHQIAGQCSLCVSDIYTVDNRDRFDPQKALLRLSRVPVMYTEIFKAGFAVLDRKLIQALGLMDYGFERNVVLVSSPVEGVTEVGHNEVGLPPVLYCFRRGALATEGSVLAARTLAPTMKITQTHLLSVVDGLDLWLSHATTC